MRNKGNTVSCFGFYLFIYFEFGACLKKKNPISSPTLGLWKSEAVRTTVHFILNIKCYELEGGFKGNNKQ